MSGGSGCSGKKLIDTVKLLVEEASETQLEVLKVGNGSSSQEVFQGQLTEKVSYFRTGSVANIFGSAKTFQYSNR